MDALGAAAVGSAVQGGIGIIGSAINYAFNKRLAAQQNQYNIDMWKMQNEYNSPSAQMQRFRDAGLNPNLIYGNGTAGNANSAPQMIVPNAPQIDKQAQEIGRLFNLVNLRAAAADADLKEQQADAQLIQNENERDKRAAMSDLLFFWQYDPKTGTFVPRSHDGLQVEVSIDPTKEMRIRKRRTGAYSSRQYQFDKLLQDSYVRTMSQQLYPSIINLRNQQARLLRPQISMKDYEAKNFPETFFIDRMNKPAGFVYGVYNGLKNYLNW